MNKGILGTLLWLMRGKTPLAEAQEEFTQMLVLTRDMVADAHEHFWVAPLSDERRKKVYETDIAVNKLEREIRKRVIVDLAVDEPTSMPTALTLMSLVKDVERIGDYAKNLIELSEIGRGPLADTDERDELRRIATEIATVLDELGPSLSHSDAEAAKRLYTRGRQLCRACDELVRRVAASEHDASNAVRLAVGARFYKRVIGHVMNVLSSVLMPVHKLDYFDESLLERTAG